MACNSCIPYVVSLYFCMLVVIFGVLLAFDNMSSRGGGAGGSAAVGTEDAGLSWLTEALAAPLDQFWIRIGQALITMSYGLYKRFTWFNLVIFVVKYVPTGVYMYKTLKSLYLTSRERIYKKHMELDDIQLQITIVNTKLCVCDAEFTERTEQLRRDVDRLRSLRARVRDMISADDALRRALDQAEPSATEYICDQDDPTTRFTPEEERQFIMAMLKEPKGEEQISIPERSKMQHLDRGEQSASSEEVDNSVYSSLSDADSKPDCHVKIVKVTNVYKVACLKHFVKQKRLRRATQQAMLKKKMENIKKLLDSWQKSLNAVIYNKMSFNPASIDMASQEAMGDYSKPNLREFSDSDSELRTSCTDVCYDEYNFNGFQNPYSYVEGSEPHEAKDLFESSEYRHEMSYGHGPGLLHPSMCDCGAAGGSVLFILPEETSSQVAIEEIDTDCVDIVS